MSGGQLALVMAKVTTTNHCGQNTNSPYIHKSYMKLTLSQSAVPILYRVFTRNLPDPPLDLMAPLNDPLLIFASPSMMSSTCRLSTGIGCIQ